jgi:hypothetical protein
MWLCPFFSCPSVPYHSPSTFFLVIMVNQHDKDEFNTECICAVVEKCDILVKQVVIGKISQETFYSHLCGTGILPEAAADYTEVMIQ